ncbi:MAG: hypothetical protein WC527_05385 [Candidatus Margulisiibacteriota bacterium]
MASLSAQKGATIKSYYDGLCVQTEDGADGFSIPDSAKIATRLFDAGVAYIDLPEGEKDPDYRNGIIDIFSMLTTSSVKRSVNFLRKSGTDIKVEGINRRFSWQDLFEAQTLGRTLGFWQSSAVTEYLALRPFMKPSYIAEILLDKLPMEIILSGRSPSGSGTDLVFVHPMDYTKTKAIVETFDAVVRQNIIRAVDRTSPDLAKVLRGEVDIASLPIERPALTI